MTTETDTDIGHTLLELAIFGPGTCTWDVGDSDCWRDWTVTIEGNELDQPHTLFTTGAT